MTAGTIALTQTNPAGRAWRLGILAAVCGVAALLLLFRAEASAAVRVWYASTAYGHCFFVLPIAAWLAWDRRDAAVGLAPEPTLWPALFAVPLAIGWFIAERLGIMEGRQLAALGLVEVLLVCLLGLRLARAFAVPLAYLVFMVPFGAFLTPALQHFTARFVAVGLDILHIPNFVDSFTIEIPEGIFYVAEACAGLRFLIAAIAFGVLYACMIYRSPWRRVAFIAVSCVVPVIANGFRALGTVVLGHVLGSAEAAEADHLLYGWIFFSIVILLLILAGLPFREDTAAKLARPRPRPPAPFSAPRAGIAVGAVVLIGASMPAVAALTDRSQPSPPVLALPGFLPAPGCLPAGSNDGLQVFVCGGATISARMSVLSPRASWGQVSAAQRDISGDAGDSESANFTLRVPNIVPSNWRATELREPDRVIASALWIDGDPARGAVERRLRQAFGNIAGGIAPPFMVVVSVQPRIFARAEDREEAQAVLRSFLAAQKPLLDQVPVALRRAAALD